MKRPRALYENAWRELNTGDLDAAKRDADRGLKLYPSPKNEWRWRFKVLKAEILVWQHLDEESLALNQAELPPSLATSDLAVWRRLSQSIASAYTQRPSDAHRYLDEASAIAEAHHPELLGQVALRKGTVLFWDGKLGEARTAYLKALELARKEKNPYLEAAALGSLGLSASKEEHYDESVDWNRAALKLSESIGAQTSVARILGNMGWSYSELGDFESALMNYRQAEASAKRNGQIGDELYWRTGIASVYYLQRDYRSAEGVLDEALDTARHQDDKSITLQYLNALSRTALETGRSEVAEKYQTEAGDVERANPDRSEMLESQLICARIEESRHEYSSAENGFLQIIGNPEASSPEKWEAEARLAQVYASESLNGKAEKEFRRALDTIETARASVETEELRLSFLSSAISFYGDYIDFLMAHGKTEEALEIAELSRARTLEEGLGAKGRPERRTIRPKEIAARSKAVVLFYWIGEPHSYLWAVTPSKLTYYRLPASAEIDPLVKAYRQAILDGKDVLSSEDAKGKRLYEVLVAPARGMIARNSRVIVVPGESLYGLNFETLIAPDPAPHFWIEDVTISTANSLGLASWASEAHGDKEKSLLLMGNPVSANPDFPALRQGPAEVQKVSAHFAETLREVLVDQQATPAAYVSATPGRFAYVHFVAHGTASHTQPLDSAVILSGSADSYKLYAREIVAHPLRARLVTISACNGAGTRAYAGEGLVGLAWAFLRAGAQNVVASLWEVSDAPSTTQLMDALYDGLDRGEDPATALRNAKLRVLKSNSNSVFRKPFYWAPFQLYSAS